MTRSFFALCLTASTLPSSAQTPEVVVSPALCDVIYRGVPNPILIGSNTCPIDSMVLSASHDHVLTCPDPGRCELTPSSDNNVQAALIYIHRRTDSGDLELLFEKTFRVHDIPDPTIFFAGKSASNNSISPELLLAEPTLSVEMPGFYWDISLEVLSFDMNIKRRSKVQHFSASNNKLNRKMKSALKDLKQGDIVRFESCMVSLPDGSVRALPPLHLTVTP